MSTFSVAFILLSILMITSQPAQCYRPKFSSLKLAKHKEKHYMNSPAWLYYRMNVVMRSRGRVYLVNCFRACQKYFWGKFVTKCSVLSRPYICGFCRMRFKCRGSYPIFS